MLDVSWQMFQWKQCRELKPPANDWPRCVKLQIEKQEMWKRRQHNSTKISDSIVNNSRAIEVDGMPEISKDGL